MIEITIQIGAGGWFVEWFDTDAELVQRWYGSREAVLKRAKRPPSKKAWCRPTSEHYVDAATQIGMYDH